MKPFLILFLTLLVYGCDENNETNKTKKEVVLVNEYPESKLIESSDTDKYKKYIYHTSDEFGEVLNFYEDIYGSPIDSNYDEHEVIKETYESQGKKYSIKLSYLDEEITEIEIKKYN